MVKLRAGRARYFFFFFRVRKHRTILERQILWKRLFFPLGSIFQLSDLNPGRLGARREHYHCAMPPAFEGLEMILKDFPKNSGLSSTNQWGSK